MTDAVPRIFNFARGANTSVPSDTSAFPEWEDMGDVRLDEGVARRRRGKVRVYNFSAQSNLFVFDGSTHWLTTNIDTRFSPLGLRFTFETLWKATSLAADRYVLGGAAGAGLKVRQTTTSTVVVDFVDSAATTTTLTFTGITVDTVCALQVVRNGASLIARLNGQTQTGAVSATLSSAAVTAALLGGNAAAASFVGVIDFARLLSSAESDARFGRLRLMNPRASNVLFDMVLIADPLGSAYVIDRGPYEMHATVAGTPSYAGAPLAHNHTPVLGLSEATDTTQAQRILTVAGSALYPMRVA